MKATIAAVILGLFSVQFALTAQAADHKIAFGDCIIQPVAV